MKTKLSLARALPLVEQIKDALSPACEHIEEAGVHSGDSACVVPPPTLSEEVIAQVIVDTRKLAEGLDVKGLLNIQFAIRGEDVFVLEANPRASRTVPFISKATGVPLAKVATRVMLGESLASLRELGVVPAVRPAMTFIAVKPPAKAAIFLS